MHIYVCIWCIHTYNIKDASWSATLMTVNIKQICNVEIYFIAVVGLKKKKKSQFHVFDMKAVYRSVDIWYWFMTSLSQTAGSSPHNRTAFLVFCFSPWPCILYFYPVSHLSPKELEALLSDRGSSAGLWFTDGEEGRHSAAHSTVWGAYFCVITSFESVLLFF